MSESEDIKFLKWVVGTIVFVSLIIFIITCPLPFLFYKKLPFVAFYSRAVFIILLASSMCLYRIARGPTGADRIVAIDILGILIVGFCAVLTICTSRSWYLDIGIAWALQSFISTLALSKYLEGKGFDE